MKKLFLSSSFRDVAHHLEESMSLELKGKSVSFIPTASLTESVTFYVKTGMKALIELGLRVEILEISKASQQEINETLNKNDFIYISGGNTFYLLQEIRKKKIDLLLTDLINSGKNYIGESAGSMILSPSIEYARMMDEESKAPDLDSFKGLGIIPFYPLPHYSNFPFKKKVDKIIDIYKDELKLFPIRNSQAIGVRGESSYLISD